MSVFTQNICAKQQYCSAGGALSFPPKTKTLQKQTPVENTELKCKLERERAREKERERLKNLLCPSLDWGEK